MFAEEINTESDLVGENLAKVTNFIFKICQYTIN